MDLLLDTRHEEWRFLPCNGDISWKCLNPNILLRVSVRRRSEWRWRCPVCSRGSGYEVLIFPFDYQLLLWKTRKQSDDCRLKTLSAEELGLKHHFRCSVLRCSNSHSQCEMFSFVGPNLRSVGSENREARFVLNDRGSIRSPSSALGFQWKYPFPSIFFEICP